MPDPLRAEEIDRIVDESLGPPGRRYAAGLLVTLGLLALFLLSWGLQVKEGVGLSGKNNPSGWVLYITTFVFWVGIAHSGTLISAILYLLRARWRTSIYRAAEAMTVFAVMTAGLFPLIHLGRLWRVYYLFPYPNQREIWPNFVSPLMWDVVAVNTYLTVSGLFFLLGLVPDLATLRDRSTGLRRRLYGLLALGWTGSAAQWLHYRAAYGFFAALATPLVISVHSVVSWDFAVSIVPGWHSTIFAPYFVAGAIHSGLAMVITLLVPMRRIMGFTRLITIRDLEQAAKVLVFTGLIVGYAYGVEAFCAWYSGNPYEKAQFLYRATGAYAPLFWIMVAGNVVAPLLFLGRRFRTSPAWLVGVSLFVNVGMWLERYVIITASLSHDFLPYAWGVVRTTPTEVAIVVGSFGLFGTLFLLFAKTLPPVATTEMKEDLHRAAADGGAPDGGVR